jgi:hypothetical protein
MSAYSREATYFKLNRPELERAAARLRNSRVRVSRAGGDGRAYRVRGRGGDYLVTLATPLPELELGHCTCRATVLCRHLSAAVIYEAGLESARKAVAR